eukprot:4590989-Alexandrium_andersonii.AAC.1
MLTTAIAVKHQLPSHGHLLELRALIDMPDKGRLRERASSLVKGLLQSVTPQLPIRGHVALSYTRL